ncbi:sterol desaturase family protein [Paraconexibacter sp.]|uniref:sterol desaturase family protein n=1 Tax=Paraconexibacter sp. TaxID=2949640 RepID=UPI0035677F01
MASAVPDAATDATPRLRAGADVRTLGEARRQFWLRPSPKLLVGGIVTIAVLRGLLGSPDWRDAVAVAAICAVYPFGEWAIHVYLLHLPPLRVRGRAVELPTAASHRQHHERPHDLNMVLLARFEAGLLLFGALPAVVGAGALLSSLLGATPPTGALVSAWLAGAVLVLAYEWTHFLIHTAHRPRSRHYRAIHRQHRLHHFKNEHYWHGITSTVGDRAFRTNPDQRDVHRSRTARTLRDDA